MKKTLAIVLALVMVLSMIPALSAGTTETITDKQYELAIYSWNKTVLGDKLGSASKANSVTANYYFDTVENADVTGRWTEDAKMAVVEVKGFDAQLNAAAESVTVDGKALATSSDAEYIPGYCGYDPNTQTVWFPVELTKAGYTDTFVVQVVGKNGDKTITETAKVSIKLVNKDSYKDVETAIVTNIVSTNADGFGECSAYIVGDKIYLDFVEENPAMAEVKITFAKANGTAFSEITYAQNPLWKNAAGDFVEAATKISTYTGAEKKLDASAMKYHIAEDGTYKFTLETKAAYYETKAYTVKARFGIVEEDPKGIYFAETTKTIAMGEKYAPVVMGVKTGKVVAATLRLGANTDEQVIDLVDDDTAVIGTREGVAYISAQYSPNCIDGTYFSSSMKIIVTLPGESIPAVESEATVYYVTCRALNVRAGAGTSFKKVDLIHRGDAVKVVELKNGWAKLDNGTYVCAKYIAK